MNSSESVVPMSMSSVHIMPKIKAQLVDSSEPVLIPTAHGTFEMRAWIFADGSEHMALLATDSQGTPIAWHNEAPVRVHSECATGDLFGSYRCDCGEQLAKGLEIIQEMGGYLIYVRNHEGRGIGLVNKLRAYALQDAGQDTLDANLSLGLAAEARDYTQTALILKSLGLESIQLISNNPNKAKALSDLGVQVSRLIPDRIGSRAENRAYLATKRQRMHHKI